MSIIEYVEAREILDSRATDRRSYVVLEDGPWGARRYPRERPPSSTRR